MRRTNVILMAAATVLQLSNCLTAQPAAETQGQAKWQSHFPEQPELYVPMPLPAPKPSIGLMTLPPQSQLVTYDAVTGEQTVSQVGSEGVLFEKWVGGSGGVGVETVGQQMGLMNFTDLSEVGNPAAYPWSVNCKLFFKQWDPSTQTVRYYVGSGILIDPMHVLTAGHCLHAGDGAHWSTDMIVVPAYYGGARPYGDAQGVAFLSWTPWTQDSNFDCDLGIIKLDRPVGALTGWFGYGYSDDPSYYTQGTFHNASYPAAFPYDGQEIYYWSGSFDFTEYDAYQGRWIGNEVGFYRSSFGGQSGSGVYARTDSNRYIVAVISNGRPGVTNCPRINAGIAQDIGNYVSANTPAALDLMALRVRISAASVTAGDRLASLSYVVHNCSSAAWSGTVGVNVYLSTNTDISVWDTLINSHSFWGSFEAKSTAEMSVQSPLRIPASTPPGDYWIGIVLDVADGDINNNDSDGQEAAPIRINP